MNNSSKSFVLAKDPLPTLSLRRERDRVVLQPEVLLLVVGLFLLLAIAAVAAWKQRHRQLQHLHKSELQPLLATRHATVPEPQPQPEHEQQDVNANTNANAVHANLYTVNRYPGRPIHSLSMYPSPRLAKRFVAQVVSNKAIALTKIHVDRIVLARGHTCDVVVGRYRSVCVAIKKLNKPSLAVKSSVADFMQEICLHGSLHHPQIVQLVGFSRHERRGYYAVMEYMNGGDLRTFLAHRRRTGEYSVGGFDRERCHFACQIAKALVYLHSTAVAMIHHDVSALNVLVNDRLQAKLSDFGSAHKLWDSSSPEMAFPPAHVITQQHWDEKADVFAFGAVLYELAFLRPYTGHDGLEASVDVAPTVACGIHTGSMNATTSCASSWTDGASMEQIMVACLSTDPRARPTAGMVLRQIESLMQMPIPPPQHAWVNVPLEMNEWWRGDSSSRPDDDYIHEATPSGDFIDVQATTTTTMSSSVRALCAAI